MKKTLLYAPVIYRFDKGFWPPSIVDGQYFLWQNDLFRMLMLLGVNIIWKAGPRTNSLKDPMKDIVGCFDLVVGEGTTVRVRYSTAPLKSELKRATHVLVDYPSTPMYDAIMANKPVICILPLCSADIKAVRDDYKVGVHVANDDIDYREILRKFLNSNPNFGLGKRDWVTALAEEVNK